MPEPKKMDLKSMSITEDQKAKLKQLFPEVFTENKIDFEKLKLTLGYSLYGTLLSIATYPIQQTRPARWSTSSASAAVLHAVSEDSKILIQKAIFVTCPASIFPSA